MYHQYDHLFEPVVVLSKEGIVCYVNHIFLSFTKTTPRLIKKGPMIDEILSIKHSSSLLKLLKTALTKKDVTISPEVEMNLAGKDEVYFVVAKIVPLSDGNAAVCFHNYSDERSLHDKYKQKLLELKDSHAALVQADKMKTLGELTAGIAHEINGPLSVARGNVEVLQFDLDSLETKNVKKKKEIVKNTDKIIKAIDRVTKIINNMRRYAHSRDEKREYADLSEIIESAFEMVSTYISQSGVAVKIVPPNEKVISLVNRTEIEQVIVNLINNAIDAIVGANITNGKVEIRVGINKSKDVIELTVTDNGPGILQKNREKIFAPFFTTKDVEKGTGLGLSITKKMIEKHQGTIAIDPTTKKGAKFLITLPIVEISSLALSPNFLEGYAEDTRKKIMVVDDDVEILNILSSFIEQAGHFMVGSTNPREALDLLGKISIDMIITDCYMPEMTGTEFSKKIRQIDKKIPIVYLSGLKHIDVFKKDEKKFIINGFLSKPFTKNDVVQMIEKALGL